MSGPHVPGLYDELRGKMDALGIPSGRAIGDDRPWWIAPPEIWLGILEELISRRAQIKRAREASNPVG